MWGGGGEIYEPQFKSSTGGSIGHCIGKYYGLC